MTRLEVRNIPVERMVRYLVEEFAGAEVPGGVVRGDGWQVAFARGEPVKMRVGAIPVVFIEVSGEREAEAAAFLRQRTMRGGG